MSLGFQRAGWDVLGVERDGDAWHTHRNNVGPCRLHDITEFRPNDRFDAVIGGVPCQGFSMAGLRKGSMLFRHLIRIGQESGARALMIENVEGMVTWRDKCATSPTFGSTMPEIIVSEMASAGFVATWKVINCADFGTPQIRKRIIFIAFRGAEAEGWEWPSASHGDGSPLPWVSVRQALSLEGSFAIGRKEGVKAFQGTSFIDVDRPSFTVTTEGNANFLSPLDAPAPCITASEHRSAQNFGAHGAKTKPRHALERLQAAGTPVRLGPEELAIMQGFPHGFKFHGNKTAQYRQIGNAFPPQPAEALGRALAFALAYGES